MAQIKDETKQARNWKMIGTTAATVAVVAGLIAGLTLTSVGQAVLFALTDTHTVLEVKDMKTEYVNEFSMGLE